MLGNPSHYRIDTLNTSTKGKKRLSREERQLIKLSSNSSQALIGILLGDGHLQKRSSTANSRFMFAQTSVDHKAYYEFVFKLFEPYCTADMKSYLKTWTDKRYGKVYQSLSFATMALPCFNVFRESFYPNGKKIVPVNIGELLTDISLAHWIMDDGSKQGKGIHLNVYAFSEEDIKRLTDTLSNKFGLKCSVHTPKNKPRIYLKAESMIQLRTIVKHHMHPSMYYKIDLIN
ncbi:hypothetical protein INT47_004844 [Mucor saturninus]|uniref:Homing endonuclease LAGLIDADG domain-containing protein n=1 Tax=Mucor saturninus TaxID=64648 RepID=A0A8H7UU64_9FUNG|nr:hypothetical protein INT47_004844 [Mucor saturninus]